MAVLTKSNEGCSQPTDDDVISSYHVTIQDTKEDLTEKIEMEEGPDALEE